MAQCACEVFSIEEASYLPKYILIASVLAKLYLSEVILKGVTPFTLANSAASLANSMAAEGYKTSACMLSCVST